MLAGPSLDGQELVEDPHLLERGLYIPIELPGIGTGLAKRVAWELHPNPAGYEYGRVPTLGQDSSYVFGEVLGASGGRDHNVGGAGYNRLSPACSTISYPWSDLYFRSSTCPRSVWGLFRIM